MTRKSTATLVLCLTAGLLLAGCACGGEDKPEDGADNTTADKGGDEKGGDEKGGDEKGGDDDSGDEAAADETPKPKASSAGAGAPPAAPFETRWERYLRLAQGDVSDGFNVSVVTLALVEAKGKDRYGRRQSGVVLRLEGLVTNNTGKTLYTGFLSGALILRFGGDVVKVQLGSNGLKPEASDAKPWRTGRARLFKVETFVEPRILMEYTPDSAEARLFAAYEDPIEFKVEAPIWSAPLDWLAVRGAAVAGKGTVFKSEGLRVGPRGKAVGKTQVNEKVDLLYAQGEFYRVRAAAGEGWVSQRSLIVPDLKGLFNGAKPHGSGKTAGDELVSITVSSVSTTDNAPAEMKLKTLDGERLFLADVSLENKGEKDIKCSAFFVDYGPKAQTSPIKGWNTLSGALECEGDKLAPGATASGKVAFLRKRHQVPFTVGYASPSKGFPFVDIYSAKETEPYIK